MTESPELDAKTGTGAAVALLARLGSAAGCAGPDALMHALLALLAGYGRDLPVSHQLRGFCGVIQRRIEGRP